MAALQPKPARCPGCQREGSLLVAAQAMAIMPAKGNVAGWYGEPAFGWLMSGTIVECNYSDCGWQQPIEEFQRCAA